MVVTYRVSGPNARFISSYTRCGFSGTLSKCVRRWRVALRSCVDAAQTERSFSSPADFSSRATSTKSSSAAFASEAMPRSGAKILPSWVGSMSTWTKVRPSVYTSSLPVWRLAQRLPMPRTKSDSRKFALP